ncbi:MAG: basic amino acid ABC transporter substrate-binding protein [Drouetiella hepatica Uher 2000/2452]|uniref:Basic amino acid ABC transporter substrate-binding protein n=1 Tax=Drouetiella hepatica Uher 2000/2452 TaxID=904376 RepID=A0A951Q7T2_9CYAN|nr:basic amino acid ABC transporter substrate-binding protein [Drouetiella hepatica Uher 2000/2452]
MTRSRFLRQLILGLLSLGCVVVFAACGSPTPTADTSAGSPAGSSPTGVETLKVAIDPTFAPFQSKGTSGSYEGFDIDLLNALSEAAGFKAELQQLPFDGIIPALQAGTVDATISTMTITAERAKTVDFSSPYFKAGLAIAVQDSNTDITSLESLKGKKVAVQIGTTGADTAKAASPSDLRTFDSAPLALQELANGNVDAVVNDAPVTLYAIKSGNIKGLKVVGQLLTEEYYGMATPKGSPNLAKINSGLATIISNGKYAEVYEKWFSGTPPTLPDKAPI